MSRVRYHLQDANTNQLLASGLVIVGEFLLFGNPAGAVGGITMDQGLWYPLLVGAGLDPNSGIAFRLDSSANFYFIKDPSVLVTPPLERTQFLHMEKIAIHRFPRRLPRFEGPYTTWISEWSGTGFEDRIRFVKAGNFYT